MVLATVASEAAAQSAPVPESGSWVIDARLSAPMVGSVQDQVPIQFRVNPCGDRVDVINSNLVGGSLPLFWVPVASRYTGEGGFYGGGMTGLVAFDIAPESRTRMRGTMSFTAPGMITQPWDVTVVASQDPGPAQGYGEVRRGNTRQSQQGVFVEVADQYLAILSQFERGSAELLPNHYPALDQAAALIAQDHIAGTDFCYADVRLNGVEGFADPRLESGNWIATAQGRATNTRAALLARGFPLGNTSINQDYNYSGAPGRGTDACKRAAVATFSIARTRIEPVSEATLEVWMRRWLADAQTHPENEIEFEARDAKARYCFAAGIMEALVNGACPARGTDIYEALRSGSDGTRASIESMFDALPSDGVLAVTPGDRNANLSDMALATQVTCSNAARAEADRLERDVLDISTDWGGRD